MKRFLPWVIMMGVIFLCGCETMEGFGRDMKKAGNWVEEKSKGSSSDTQK